MLVAKLYRYNGEYVNQMEVPTGMEQREACVTLYRKYMGDVSGRMNPEIARMGDSKWVVGSHPGMTIHFTDNSDMN